MSASIVAFQLSMPNANSWNGRWSGECRCYVKVVNLGRGKRSTERAAEIVKRGYYHYNFGDGWSAGVRARLVTSSEARKLRAKSDGFCGYDWMVDSIISSGVIVPRKVAK